MSSRRDPGTILILTLVFTVVLAVIVLALANYVAVGLRTSDTTDLRSETNADGAAVVTWAMEEFRLGNLDVSADCPSNDPMAGTPIPLSAVDSSINVNGSELELFCSTRVATGSFPVITLAATATKDGVRREVLAVAQIAPPPQSAVRALDWSVDDVPLNP